MLYDTELLQIDKINTLLTEKAKDRRIIIFGY